MLRLLPLLPLLLLAACASQQQSGFLGAGRQAEVPVLVAMNESRPRPSQDQAEGCAYDSSGDANFGFVHSLSSGTRLFVCGTKVQGDGLYGQLYVQAKGENSAESSRINLGGVSESFEPFGTELVQVLRKSDGLDLVDLLPWKTQEFLPAFRRHVACDARGCEEKAMVCVFRRPKGRVNPKAYEALAKDWKANTSLASEEAARELVKGNGAVGRNARKQLQGDVYMEVYRNALLGHKPSIALLLDENLNERLNERYKDEVGELGGFPHNVIHKAVAKLRKHHCL